MHVLILRAERAVTDGHHNCANYNWRGTSLLKNEYESKLTQNQKWPELGKVSEWHVSLWENLATCAAETAMPVCYLDIEGHLTAGDTHASPNLR